MELLITHLVVSLYVINFILVVFGVICIISLWSSKDFSNSIIIMIFLFGILVVNLIWRLLALPELSF